MPNWCAARAAMAAAAGRRSKPITSKSSPASGGAVTLGSPIALLIPNKDFKIDADGRPRPAAAGPWRSERLDQVSDLGPGDPRTGQRPGDRPPAWPPGPWPSSFSRRWASRPSPTSCRSANWPSRRSPARSRSSAAARDRSIMYTLDPDRDEQVAELIDRCKRGRRHAGRHRRDSRRGPALRTGHAHAMGQEARRPAGPGRDGRAGDEGRRDRHGFRGRADARLAGPRPDPLRSRPGRTRARSVSRGRTTTPAGWRPA